MPAYGPGDPPPVVVRRKRRAARRARVQRAPRTEHLPATVKPAPAPRVAAGDTKGDVHAGESFKRTAPYRGAVRVAYKSKPLAARKQRVAVARRRAKAGRATPEDRNVLHYHDTAVAGSKRVARANRAFEALDPVNTAIRHGAKPTSARGLSGTGPKVKRKEQSVLGKVGSALGKAVTAVGAASSQGYASVHAPKILVNAPKDLADLVVTTPSSVAKLGSDVVHHPGKVPGELAAPYVELAKHPKEFVTEHPVSTVLMVAPAGRIPGRAAGRVARVAGKQSLERPAATFAGTNLREVRTGSKDYVVRRRQARKDAASGAPQMTEGQVNRRVDSFFDTNRREQQRMVAGAARDAQARGLTGDALDAKLSGARKGAKKVVRRRFAQEFGGETFATPEAALDHAASLPFEGKVMKVAKGQHTVVPKFAADRLRGHEQIGKSKATGAKLLRTSRRAFTRTVLPFSSTWLSGQAIESAFRAMVSGSGPVSYVRGARVVRRLDPEARARLLPGGKSRIPAEMLEGGGRTLADEYAGTSLARIANAATALGRAPVPRNVLTTHRAVTDFVFDTLNGRIVEATAQKAMLGRALKESPLMERRVVGLSSKAIAEAADGLKATENQVALGRELHKMYGKYTGFSPDARESILHWTPFAPWLANMAKFVAVTLPKDHPVSAALLADLDAATEEWRKAAGLSFHGGKRRPAYLQGGYPSGKGGEDTVRVGRYLPFAPADVLDPKTLIDLVLPQFSGAVAAFSGRDPVSDEPLHGKFGPEASPPERALAGAIQLVESMVPGVGITHRVREKGARRVFDPLAPVKRHKPKAKVRRKGQPKPISLFGPSVKVSNPPLDLP